MRQVPSPTRLSPEGTGNFLAQGLSAVDIDGDQLPEIIALGIFQIDFFTLSTNQLVFAFDEGLTLKSGWPHDTEIDCILQTMDHPLFVDLDNDGELEYIGPTAGVYDCVYVWNLDGSFFAPEIAPQGNLANPPEDTRPGGYMLLGDVDGNGYTDIVSAITPGNIVHSAYDGQGIVAWDRKGEILPGWPIDHNIVPRYSSLLSFLHKYTMHKKNCQHFYKFC